MFLSFTSNCHCFISCTPRSVIFSLQQTQSPYEPSTVQGFPTAFKPTYLLFSTINHSRHSFTFPHHLLTPSRIVFILQKYSEFLTFSTPLPNYHNRPVTFPSIFHHELTIFSFSSSNSEQPSHTSQHFTFTITTIATHSDDQLPPPYS